jgi:hypothetical protein
MDIHIVTKKCVPMETIVAVSLANNVFALSVHDAREGSENPPAVTRSLLGQDDADMIRKLWEKVTEILDGADDRALIELQMVILASAMGKIPQKADQIFATFNKRP